MKQQRRSVESIGDYHALIWKEDQWFVAKCVEVEVASQGKTKRDALTNLREALDLLLEDNSQTIKSPSFDQLELHRIGAFAG